MSIEDEGHRRIRPMQLIGLIISNIMILTALQWPDLASPACKYKNNKTQWFFKKQIWKQWNSLKQLKIINLLLFLVKPMAGLQRPAQVISWLQSRIRAGCSRHSNMAQQSKLAKIGPRCHLFPSEKNSQSSTPYDQTSDCVDTTLHKTTHFGVQWIWNELKLEEVFKS